MREKKLVHGGDRVGFRQRHGFEPLDFSANVSPLGLPVSVKNSIIEALDDADGYPDPLCRRLVDELSDFERLSREFIMCGNGAAELVFRMVYALKPKAALVTAPSFAEYEAALRAADCQVKRYLLKEENHFRLDDGFIDEITDGTDMVFLCQPNNPTGVTDNGEVLMRILQRCCETGAVLVMDECFNEFLDSPGSHTMKGFIKSHENLVILRSFTKLYAMAGIRLGYCLCSDKKLLERMRLAGQPWSVSHIAQQAGIAALHEKEYAGRVRAVVREERGFLIERLRGLGIRVIPGEANYLLFKSVSGLDERLEKRGILIRSCGNYEGLWDGWYRIAVRTHEDNERLVKALEEISG